MTGEVRNPRSWEETYYHVLGYFLMGVSYFVNPFYFSGPENENCRYVGRIYFYYSM